MPDERDHSLALTIDGVPYIAVEDTDAITIAQLLKRLSVYGELIARFGLEHGLRVISHDMKLKQVAFTEAQGGSGLVSTLVGTIGTSKQ